MAGINPISSSFPPIGPGGGHSTPKAVGGDQQNVNFGKMLKSAVNKVDSDQHESYSAIQDLITGKSNDVLPVVAAVAKADLSFKLLMGVRNKVIEAYKQTMNMPL